MYTGTCSLVACGAVLFVSGNNGSNGFPRQELVEEFD
jgi:hypothetical protein